MDRNKRMLKNSLIYFIGNFGSKMLTFILLPLYTRYLTPEQYGTVDLLISLLPLIGPLFTLQAADSAFRFLCENDSEKNRKHYITASLMLFIIGAVIFTVLYIPITVFFNFQYKAEFYFYFILTYLGMYLQQVSRGIKQNQLYAFTGIISTLIQGVTNVLLIKVIQERSIFISGIIAFCVIIIYIILKTKMWRYIKMSYFRKDVVRKQLKYGLPLIPNQICWWLNGILGKYILIYFRGANSSGIIALATKFPNLITTLNSIFFMAWTENTILEYENEDRDEYFSSMLNAFLIFQLVLLIFLLPITKIYNVLTIVDRYRSALYVIPILYIGSFFNSLATFLGTAYTASLQTTKAFSTTVTAAAINIVASLILIPITGIYGFSIAQMIAYFILAVLRLKSVYNIIKFKISFDDLIPEISLLISTIFIYYNFGTLGQIIGFAISALILSYVNRKLIIAIYTYIKSIIIKHK